MPGYRVTPEAIADIQDIWSYIAKSSTSAANRVEDEIFAAFSMLGADAAVGHYRLDLADKLVRFWTIYSYVIAYLADRDPIRTLAVFHGRRDLPNLIQERLSPPL